jgi:hypothetical protein
LEALARETLAAAHRYNELGCEPSNILNEKSTTCRCQHIHTYETADSAQTDRVSIYEDKRNETCGIKL